MALAEVRRKNAPEVADTAEQEELLAKLTAERGAEDPEVQRRIRRVLWVSRVELVLLIAIIYVMVTKPGQTF